MQEIIVSIKYFFTMGRSKHCSVEKRQLIWNLYQKGKSQVEIATVMNCSRKMVYNAIKDVKADPSLLKENKKQKARWRKTTPREDNIIVRKSRANPFKSSREIMTEVNAEMGLNISSKLVRRRLNERNLFGRQSRKKPHLSTRNIAARKAFANSHRCKNVSFWKRVLFSDETKINRLGPDGKAHVFREINQQFNPRYTQKTIKHGGGSLMVWGSFSWHGVGPLVRIVGNMDQYQYLEILKNTMDPYCFDNMPINFIFMHDNDPKHTARSVKNWLLAEKIPILDWPAQSPDLNPIENLWNDVKLEVAKKKFNNLDELWEGVKEVWNSIPLAKCQRLIESLPRRCDAVLKNKGFPTKY